MVYSPENRNLKCMNAYNLSLLGGDVRIESFEIAGGREVRSIAPASRSLAAFASKWGISREARSLSAPFTKESLHKKVWRKKNN